MELSITPSGGKSIPAVPKSTAESHDRKAIFVFIAQLTYIGLNLRQVEEVSRDGHTLRGRECAGVGRVAIAPAHELVVVVLGHGR